MDRPLFRRSTGERWLLQSWQRRGWFAILLWPLSLVYCVIMVLRRRFWRRSIPGLPVPVIVVGNINVGGTGKTPMVIWLSDWLRQQGWRPGIVSRGYGGRFERAGGRVETTSSAADVGDEPLLIHLRTHAPVRVGRDRLDAAYRLLRETDCNVIIADDGLQHYRLPRDLEILMVDGERSFGNALCLPAGPLREPLSRLKSVDYIVVTGAYAAAGALAMKLSLGRPWRVRESTSDRILDEFRNQPVHAVAGISNPERFFSALEVAGLNIVRHSFPDHYPYQPHDLDFSGKEGAPILMTEKDAVKCLNWAPYNCWAVPVIARLPVTLETSLNIYLRTLRHGQETVGNPRMPGHQGSPDL